MKKRTKNKLLAFGIIMCMLFAMAVMPVSAAIVESGTCGENLTWTLDDSGTLTISGTGAMTDYDSDSYNSAPWDNSRSSVKTVIIQNGVTNIGGWAFSYCSSLTSITIPESVTSIGDYTFSWCDSLTSITIPDGVTSIGYSAFRECSSLTSITIPESVTIIGEAAFFCCISLTSITIPDGVMNISNQAFDSCSSLTSITIPESVTSIGDYAFFWCDSLTSITIPDSVTSIGDGAFHNCSSLTSVTIPDSVTSIGNSAFDCCRFTSITIPDSVTYIDAYAFVDCGYLKSIAISDNVTSIEKGVFFGCMSLDNVTIPESVTCIGDDAFSFCSSLTSITIPDGVASIGDCAFSGCSSLTDVYYGGTPSQWSNISIGSDDDEITSATIHYNCIFANKLKNRIDYSGETVSLPGGAVLDTGEALNFRNGYVNTGESGYVKAGNKKITGSNIYFTGSGKMRLDAGETAKIERDNGDGTTDQGFLAGVYNPTGIIKMTLSVSGTVNDKDYTGRTISKDFDFTSSEISGLANFGFEVKRVPKPLELSVKSIE